MHDCLFHLSSPFYLLGHQASDHGLLLTHVSSFNTFFALYFIDVHNGFGPQVEMTHMGWLGLTTWKMQGKLIVASYLTVEP